MDNPLRTIHCSICEKGIRGYDFPERMQKLRRHYKSAHPTEFRKWGRRNLVVVTNPLLESVGTAAITGVGVGLGFRGLDFLLGPRKQYSKRKYRKRKQ